MFLTPPPGAGVGGTYFPRSRSRAAASPISYRSGAAVRESASKIEQNRQPLGAAGRQGKAREGHHRLKELDAAAAQVAICSIRQGGFARPAPSFAAGILEMLWAAGCVAAMRVFRDGRAFASKTAWSRAASSHLGGGFALLVMKMLVPHFEKML